MKKPGIVSFKIYYDPDMDSWSFVVNNRAAVGPSLTQAEVVREIKYTLSEMKEEIDKQS